MEQGDDMEEGAGEHDMEQGAGGQSSAGKQMRPK